MGELTYFKSFKKSMERRAVVGGWVGGWMSLLEVFEKVHREEGGGGGFVGLTEGHGVFVVGGDFGHVEVGEWFDEAWDGGFLAVAVAQFALERGGWVGGWVGGWGGWVGGLRT